MIEKIDVEVPVFVEGTPKGAAVAFVDIQELKVRADVSNLPEKIVVNVEGLTDGTKVFAKDIERGHVTGLKVVSVAPGENGPFTRQPGTERVLPADLVLISVGFLHPDTETILDQMPVELDGLGGRTQADNHVDTGVTQVQRVGVTLGTVAQDGHLLAIEHGQIGVLLVPDSCCHF